MKVPLQVFRFRSTLWSIATLLTISVATNALLVVATGKAGEPDSEEKTAEQKNVAGHEKVSEQKPVADRASKPTRSLSERLHAATRNATTEKYLLQYKFKEGEKFYWTVEHGVKTDTSIQGTNETSRSHSLATKKWEVMDVSKEGVATLIYSLTDVNMRHKVTGGAESSYDSRSDKAVPDNYKHVAEAIGLSLATIEIEPTGKVARKQTNYRDIDLGMGDFTITLPNKAIPIGYKWEAPQKIIARNEKGISRNLSARKVYELIDVKLGVAEISMRTQVLTPVYDPNIESQIVQKLTNGTIKFDIDNGRVINREIRWDEEVQGFRVPDSLMVYQARLSENYVEASELDAEHSRVATRMRIKGPQDAPILRK